MAVFDFNIHLPLVSDADVDKVIKSETELSDKEITNSLHQHLPFLQHLEGGNFMVFNTSFFDDPEEISLHDELKRNFEYSCITALIDPTKKDVFAYLDKLNKNGVKGIKFHSYISQIDESKFPRAIEIAKYAEQIGLFICVDASFGTADMYTCDNIKLICALSRVVSTTPIIILHSGGARVLEAMLVALEQPNIFLETSFSLPFYQGSTIEQDLAFAYKKLGADRLLYASDYPYVSQEDSLRAHEGFFRKYGITDTDKIMFENAVQLIA